MKKIITSGLFVLTSFLLFGATALQDHQQKDNLNGQKYKYKSRTGIFSVNNQPLYMLKTFGSGQQASLYLPNTNQELLYFSQESVPVGYRQSVDTTAGKPQVEIVTVSTHFIRIVFIGTGKQSEVPYMGWEDLLVFIESNRPIVNGKLDETGINRIIEKHGINRYSRIQ